ncbi:MAG: ATP-binding protein [Spirochaetaceae bacterium]
MMRLTRMRLVNWHFFSDVTVELGTMSLLAGDNGSGKSTIIDALQYALVAKVQRIRFNAAATDRRTARTLESYTRAKVGADALDYLRGDCISHVILEFEGSGRSACAGIMVESFREGECREHPWILTDSALEEVLVYEEERFLEPRRFREMVKAAGGRVCATKGEYNNRLTHLLGVHRRGNDLNPYFEALVRSVSFTPFTSVHDFVCDYILEERTVDVGAMKENLLNYRAAEREAAAMEERILLLEEVAEKRDALLQILAQIRRQEYLRLRLLVEQERRGLEESKSRLTEEESAARELSAKIDEASTRKRRLSGQRDELQISLARDEAKLAYDRLKRDREDLLLKKAQEEGRSRRLEAATGRLTELLGRAPGNGEEEAAAVAAEVEETSFTVAEEELAAREDRTRLQELYTERGELHSGLLRYPPALEKLRAALKAEGIESELFAELLEVGDESRQELLETSLGNHRFALLVPREEYRRALEIYDAQEAEVGAIPLPNLSALGSEEVRPGSLAELLTPANPDARRLAAHLLGEVVRTELGELTAERNAVTDGGMQYVEGVANRADPEARSRWYLGRRAVERRLEQIEEEIRRVEESLREREGRIGALRSRLTALREAEGLLRELVDLTDAPTRLAAIAEELTETEKRLGEIDTVGFESLQRQLDALEEMLQTLERESAEWIEERGARSREAANLRQRMGEQERELQRHQAALEGFLAEQPERAEEFEAYYRDRMRNEGERPNYGEILGRYESSYRGLKTREERARHELTVTKQRYNHQYNTLLSLDEDESGEYMELLERYRRTELPEYRERIEHARKAAEQQFQEHFVARLNEYLIEAEESFKEINYILQEISFGKDSYRFTIQRRQEKRELMHAIAAAAEVREVEGTLFAALKSEEERRSVQEVFEKILANDLDSPEVREICDYRQYFVYDIRIRDRERTDEKSGKPLESYLSKVLREKSGGETQTPYYVAIAASFHRFYRDNPDAIRLVLFDEAFNKMDDERIGRMLDFFRKLNMQVLTAVPTEKIESVAPHMDVTNLVIRKNYSAFLRRYEQLPEVGS